MTAVGRPKVFVVQPVPDEPLDALRHVADVEVFPHVGRRPTHQELADGMLEASYVFALGENVIDEELMAASPQLAMISVMEIFPLSIDLAAATRRKIPVAGIPHHAQITETTAEFTFTLVCALSWRIPQAARFLAEGRWAQYQSVQLPTDLLRDATLGVVGLGAIGRGVARRAQAHGMSVLYTDREPLGASHDQALGVWWRDIENLFGEADVVVLTAALTRATECLVNAHLISCLKPGALLVNTSRGAVLDEEALADALEDGRLAGAALDVHGHELPYHDPRPNPRLLALPNVILTPHIGTSARQTRHWMAAQVVGNILRHHGGQRPRQLLNPEVYGLPPVQSERIG